MGLARDLDTFFRATQSDVFVEAEAKPGRMKNFMSDYNAKYSPTVNRFTDGIIILQEDANKWGLELRVYFYDKIGIPAGVQVTHNAQYRDSYSYRINDNDLIMELFGLGYRIGIN